AVDEILMRADGAGLSALLVDGIGSTLALADASGAVQTQYTFEPFGATTMSGATSTNNMQFTGRENDLDGLYYYRARYYAPGASRFIAEDPLYETRRVQPPGETLYSYVRNSPTGFIDPSGENTLPITIPPAWIPEIAVGAGTGAGVGVGVAVGVGVGVGVGIMCAASPSCRQLFRCLWEYAKDFAKCKAMKCDDLRDEFDCRDRAADNFQKCLAGLPRLYPDPRSK